MPIRVVTAIFLAMFISAPTFGDENAQKPAADLPQLEPLSNYVGEWTSESTLKSADRPEVTSMKGTATAEWIHDGRFVRQTWVVEASGDRPAFNGSSIYTFDPRRNEYRSWSFDSSGLSSEGQGKWDPKKRTFTWKGKDNFLGGETTTTADFSEPGKEKWSIILKDGNGNAAIEINGVNTRRDKEPQSK
jgi:hypothetical protein